MGSRIAQSGEGKETDSTTEIPMVWEPITLEALSNLIITDESKMAGEHRNLWDLLRISPAKWKQKPWGDEGGGFWVVGIYGTNVIWYNDIEDGFNISSYKEFGEIAEYWCNQDTLYHVMYRIAEAIHTGRDPGYKLGPPQQVPQ